MPSPTANLLDALSASHRTEKRPWGTMLWMDAPDQNLSVKYLKVGEGHRTSLQRHDRKDELLIILHGTGHIETAGTRWHGKGCMVRIRPGWPHRVTGPLAYLEVSTYDDGTDTIRHDDDYGRA